MRRRQQHQKVTLFLTTALLFLADLCKAKTCIVGPEPENNNTSLACQTPT